MIAGAHSLAVDQNIGVRGSITNRTSPNSGDNVIFAFCCVTPRQCERQARCAKAGFGHSDGVCGIGAQGTINGVKPVNVPSTVTPAPDGVCSEQRGIGRCQRDGAQRLVDARDDLEWHRHGHKARRTERQLVLARQDFDPPSVTSAVSPSMVAMTSLGVAVKVTYAQSGTSAICTVWLWLRPATSMALAQG